MVSAVVTALFRRNEQVKSYDSLVGRFTNQAMILFNSILELQSIRKASIRTHVYPKSEG